MRGIRIWTETWILNNYYFDTVTICPGSYLVKRLSVSSRTLNYYLSSILNRLWAPAFLPLTSCYHNPAIPKAKLHRWTPDEPQTLTKTLEERLPKWWTDLQSFNMKNQTGWKKMAQTGPFGRPEWSLTWKGQGCGHTYLEWYQDMETPKLRKWSDGKKSIQRP